MNQQDKKLIDEELVKIWDTLDLPKAMITMVAKRIYQKGYDRAIAEVCIENPNGYRGEWPEELKEYRRVSAFKDAQTVWAMITPRMPGFWTETGRTASIVISEEQKCLAEN